VFQSFSPRGAGAPAASQNASYTRFLQDVDAGRIRSVVFTDESTFTANAIRYSRADGTEGQVVGPMDGKLIDQLVSKNVDIVREKPSTGRSEEHTSELQSRENLVCRLLLEKKK